MYERTGDASANIDWIGGIHMFNCNIPHATVKILRNVLLHLRIISGMILGRAMRNNRSMKGKSINNNTEYTNTTW